MIACPICDRPVRESRINEHLDSNCKSFVGDEDGSSQDAATASHAAEDAQRRAEPARNFFSRPVASPAAAGGGAGTGKKAATAGGSSPNGPSDAGKARFAPPFAGDSKTAQPSANGSRKREADFDAETAAAGGSSDGEHPSKRARAGNSGGGSGTVTTGAAAAAKVAPLAERMRPRTLDEVRGQEVVAPGGMLRELIASGRGVLPSMVLWGGAGTGKTTIARLLARAVGGRFVEINSTSSGVAECKRIFAEARGDLSLTGRRTVLFCDEIHRFSRAQQDVFLGPVERGEVTLVAATTENPSFKVQAALMSRCRVFTLAKLSDESVAEILRAAMEREGPNYEPNVELVDEEFLTYLSTFASGDARIALNLLELAMEASKQPGMDKAALKKAMTKALVYDRAGDQHYDTISAFHKSIRGGSADAALYYLARMLQSGEDPLFVARRMVVCASEDVGLADAAMLPLAVAAYTAAERVGMPECAINLSHCAAALALSRKSTRAYRAFRRWERVVQEEPGAAGLPVPWHLRNAPTRLLRELGAGKDYKYNPDFLGGRVVQEYLPDKLKGLKFFEDRDLGEKVDEDLGEEEKKELAREFCGEDEEHYGGVGDEEFLLNAVAESNETGEKAEA